MSTREDGPSRCGESEGLVAGEGVPCPPICTREAGISGAVGRCLSGWERPDLGSSQPLGRPSGGTGETRSLLRLDSWISPHPKPDSLLGFSVKSAKNLPLLRQFDSNFKLH